MSERRTLLGSEERPLRQAAVFHDTIGDRGVASSHSPDGDDRTREFLRLLGQHERRLRGFILSLVPHWADAEDIAQEVRIRLWEQFDNYDPAKDFGALRGPSPATRFSPTARSNCAGASCRGASSCSSWK